MEPQERELDDSVDKPVEVLINPTEIDVKIDEMRGLILDIPAGERLFFVSDTHFFHTKLCSGYEVHFGQTRKYTTVEEMNDDIVQSWNNTVTDNDTVIFLGDLIMNVKVKELREKALGFWNQLNGKKYFIKGNHDRILKSKLSDTIDFYDWAQISYNGVIYYAQHRPIGREEGSNPYLFADWVKKAKKAKLDIDPKKVVVAFGHTHSQNRYASTGRSDYRLQNCVCWDAGYAPFNADRLGTSDMTLVGECAGHQVVAHMEK